MHSPSFKRSSHKGVEKTHLTRTSALGVRSPSSRRRSNTTGFSFCPHPVQRLFVWLLRGRGATGRGPRRLRVDLEANPGQTSAGNHRLGPAEGAALLGRGPALLAGAGPGPARDGVRGPPEFGGPDERRAVGIGERAEGPRPGSGVNYRGETVPGGPARGWAKTQELSWGPSRGVCGEGPPRLGGRTGTRVPRPVRPAPGLGTAQPRPAPSSPDVRAGGS